MELADAFGMAYNIKYDLHRMLQKTVRLHLLTDSLSLFNSITTNSIITEEKLVIDWKNVKKFPSV